jgi:hypothetical protein
MRKAGDAPSWNRKIWYIPTPDGAFLQIRLPLETWLTPTHKH